MITIRLYNNKSEKNKVNKTLTLLSTQTNVTLKQAVSIMDPVLMLEGVEVVCLANCNYLYIEELKRYYYVNDITSVRNGLVQLRCHVDVLESFKTEILANTAVIRRQEKKYNLYLDDGIFKTYNNKRIQTRNFPNGFTTASFVFAVAGQ